MKTIPLIIWRGADATCKVFGTGMLCYETPEPYGIQGLGRIGSDGALELLVIFSNHAGRGKLSRWMSLLTGQYRIIRVIEVFDEWLEQALIKWGFEFGLHPDAGDFYTYYQFNQHYLLCG